MGQVVAIMLGGALGALARFAVTELMMQWLGKGFPYGTLVVNATGSFLIGALSVYFMTKVHWDPMLKMAIAIGFLGAFTTFSTFSLDTISLFETGDTAKALLNIALNVCTSLAAVWAGLLAARFLTTH